MTEAINPRRRPIISVGECMVELARGGDGRFGLAYGGDTFNTSVYLARAGAEVSYATALGDDPYSAGILNLARHEGVGTTLITIATGRMPGLYLIETSAKGERTFHYWRDRSPARELFDGPGAEAIVTSMQQAGLVFFSAVTLSLYSTAGLARFAEALQRARIAGTTIVMDGNYRPRGWQNDPEQARGVIHRFWALTDLALPTFDDEALLWGDADATATIARLRALGAREVAVKLGQDGALVATDGVPTAVPAPTRIAPIDTTGAGDSFNAAYLAARMQGRTPIIAAQDGNRLAGIVIQHRGAVVPAEATAPVFRP
jgi:2-dehydro-3-deoxygluconokinase